MSVPDGVIRRLLTAGMLLEIGISLAGWSQACKRPAQVLLHGS
jgi:hypothetical protein